MRREPASRAVSRVSVTNRQRWYSALTPGFAGWRPSGRRACDHAIVNGDAHTQKRPLSIAITGSIGAGKSTALAAFARHGAAWISSDAIVHTLLATDERHFAEAR